MSRSPISRVLIAGCGDLGTRLGLALADRGATVWGLRRSPERLPPAIHGLRGDLATPEGIESIDFAALGPFDLVVYALAADRFDDDAYRRAYVDGVRHLLAALEKTPPSLWLHVSSTSVYAQSAGEWVDESSATEPGSFGGRRLLEGEALLAAAPVRSTILRLSGIYGPGRNRLLESVRRGRATCAEPPVFTNRIHVEDAVGALMHLATLEEPEPVYIGVDHEPTLDGEVKRWLASRLGVPAPKVGPPSSTSRRMRSNKRCSNRRLLAAGYTFRYPDFRAGYAALIEELE